MRLRSPLLLIVLALLTIAPLSSAASAAPSGNAVLIGVPGLRWDQVSQRDTPNLWRLAGEGSTAALSVRTLGTIACPIDAWLTVSAGARSARDGGSCKDLPQQGSTSLPGFEETRRRNIEGRFQAPVGLLGQSIHQAGGCTAAAGAGAALAVADAKGKIDHYSPTAEGLNTDCTVAVADIDDVLRAPDDLATVKKADARVGALLGKLKPGTTVLVAGLSDNTGEAIPKPRLRMLIASGPLFPAGKSIVSDSTRRDGTVITPDLTATLLHAVGVTVPDESIGRVLRQGGDRDTPLGSAIEDLAGQDVGAQTYRTVLPKFFLGLVIAQVAFFTLAALLLSRLRNEEAGGRRRVLGVTRLVALISAAVPVSTYLVNLIPWMNSGSPKLALLGGIALCDALVVTAALAGPWRRGILGPGTVVAATTATTIAIDLLTGTHLQVFSLMGYSPLVGGRYYGLGNIAFAVFATSTILTAVGIAQWLVNRGHGRRAAVSVVVGLCVTAMVLDGAPMWGADFGGVIAIIPGLAITALMVAEKKISLIRLAVFCAVGGLTVMSIAFLDHQRAPVDQTHLGRFFGDLLQGHAGPTVERKFVAMVKTIKNPTLFPIVLAGIAFLVTALRRPDKVRAGTLHRAFDQAPLLRAGLTGALATAVVGFGVNDSGIAVLALALVVAIPITLAAAIQTLRIPNPAPTPDPVTTQPAAA